jgi:hypothetical protein
MLRLEKQWIGAHQKSICARMTSALLAVRGHLVDGDRRVEIGVDVVEQHTHVRVGHPGDAQGPGTRPAGRHGGRRVGAEAPGPARCRQAEVLPVELAVARAHLPGAPGAAAPAEVVARADAAELPASVPVGVMLPGHHPHQLDIVCGQIQIVRRHRRGGRARAGVVGCPVLALQLQGSARQRQLVGPQRAVDVGGADPGRRIESLRREEERAPPFGLHAGGRIGRRRAVGHAAALVARTEVNHAAGLIEQRREVLRQPQRDHLALRVHRLRIARPLLGVDPGAVGDRQAIVEARERGAVDHHAAIVGEILQEAVLQAAFGEVGQVVRSGVLQPELRFELPQVDTGIRAEPVEQQVAVDQAGCLRRSARVAGRILAFEHEGVVLVEGGRAAQPDAPHAEPGRNHSAGVVGPIVELEPAEQLRGPAASGILPDDAVGALRPHPVHLLLQLVGPFVRPRGLVGRAPGDRRGGILLDCRRDRSLGGRTGCRLGLLFDLLLQGAQLLADRLELFFQLPDPLLRALGRGVTAAPRPADEQSGRGQSRGSWPCDCSEHVLPPRGSSAASGYIVMDITPLCI